MRPRQRIHLAFFFLLILIIAPTRSVFSGGYLIVTNTGIPYKWNPNLAVPFNPDKGTLGLLNNADAVSFVSDNFNLWSTSNIPTSSLTFSNAGALPVDVNNVSTYNQYESTPDGISPIIFDTDGSIFSALGYPPGVLGFAGPEYISISAPFYITEGIAVLNGAWIDGDNSDGREMSMAEFAGVFAHEFGHFLNLDHSQVNGHYFLGDTDDPGFQAYGAPAISSVTLMFPFLIPGQPETPQTDDRRAISALYPNTGFFDNTGSIHGSVYQENGTTLLQGANVIARNPADPFMDASSYVSGALYTTSFPYPAGGSPSPALQGAFSLNGLTPNGTYTLEIVNVNPDFIEGSSVGPLSPPIALSGPEEFYNGANESADPATDDPLSSTQVAAQLSAGTTGIDFVLNGSGGGTVLNPPLNLEAILAQNSVVLNWDPPGTAAFVAMSGRRRLTAKYDQTSFQNSKKTSTTAYQRVMNVGEIEPNNDPSQAQVLSGTSPIAVDGNAEVDDAGNVEITFTNGATDDIEDLYLVSTTAPGLTINLEGFSSDCDLYLIDSGVTTVLGQSNQKQGTGTESIDDPTLAADTYLIAVSIYDRRPVGGSSTPYVLTVTGAFGSGDHPPNLQAYYIYRSLSANAKTTGSLIASVDASTTSYTDSNLNGETHFYQVTALFTEGESGPSNEVSVLITDVQGNPIKVPEQFTLKQNYPNPFNPMTEIHYALPAGPGDHSVKLEIYNLLGQKVRTLINEKQTSGEYRTQWFGEDDSGGLVPSGIYVYRLRAGDFVQARKMVFLQ